MPAFTVKASTPNVSPLSYVAGDTMVLTFSVVDDAGVAVNLTGATFRWGVGKRISIAQIGTPVVTKTLGSGVVVATPTSGVAVVTLTAGDMTAIGDYIHELEITISGVSRTYARGWFRSIASVFPAA